jgi:hypothetical protein
MQEPNGIRRQGAVYFFISLFFYYDDEGIMFLRNVRLSLSYSSTTDCQLARHPLLTLIVFKHSKFSLLNLQFTLLKMTTLSLNAHRCWYVNLPRHFIITVSYTGCSIQNSTEQCITRFQFQPVLQTLHVFPQTEEVQEGHKLFTIFQTYTNQSSRNIEKRIALYRITAKNHVN